MAYPSTTNMASTTPIPRATTATFQEALSSIPCPQQAQTPVRQLQLELDGQKPGSTIIQTKAYNLRSSTSTLKVYNPSLNSQSSRPSRPTLHLDSNFNNFDSVPSTYTTLSAPAVSASNNQDFVLSDHFADTRTIQSHLCNYLEAHTKQLSALQALLITSIAKDNSSNMSSVPATPPQHQTDLGMVADFKTSDGDFDPLSFLTDFDSIPVPSTYRQADFATTVAPLANAFHAFRNVSGFEDTSPSLTPFGLDDDTPPVNTPALEADDGSTITSPIWNDFSSFNLFPSCGQTDLLGSAFSKTSFADPSTVSPTDLALPLPLPQCLPPVVPTPAAPAATTKRKYNTKKRSATPADDAFEVDEAPLPKRKRQTSQAATFNGTRNTAVPYVPVDAPTQTRQYHGPPSKTSKRDVPAAAAKKVAALKAQAAMMGTEAPADVIEQSIEEKRRQNTVAARRSRLRKAEHLSKLEEQVRSQQEQLLALQAEKDRLELERQTWMARAIHAGWKEI